MSFLEFCTGEEVGREKSPLAPESLNELVLTQAQC
jgi:hypothetical protein